VAFDARSVPTAEGVDEDEARARSARVLRRAFLVALTAFIVLGLLNVWGVRTATTQASDGDHTLEVRYPRVARAGLPVAFEIAVTKRGGFDGSIAIAVDAGYLGLFDENAKRPEPAESTRADGREVWRFTPPEGERFTASLDVRIEPSRRWGQHGRVWLLDEAGAEVLTVGFYTWIAP